MLLYNTIKLHYLSAPNICMMRRCHSRNSRRRCCRSCRIWWFATPCREDCPPPGKVRGAEAAYNPVHTVRL